MTNVIISTTEDDNYLFFLPIAEWAWGKLGVKTVCFIPLHFIDEKNYKKLNLAIQNASTSFTTSYEYFKCPDNKNATYAQCARLFAGTLRDGGGGPYYKDEDIFITSDIDMAVFSKDLIQTDDKIHVWGTDLVPPGQIPICYISMPKSKWKQVMRCDNHSYQEMLDHHLGSIECDNFKANYWAKDQEMAFTHITPHDFIEHKRAKPGTQFATRRLDRDDSFLLDKLSPDIIDYHMPRPGYEENNFNQILSVLKYFYPNENFDWLLNYRNEYVKLL